MEKFKNLFNLCSLFKFLETLNIYNILKTFVAKLGKATVP